GGARRPPIARRGEERVPVAESGPVNTAGNHPAEGERPERGDTLSRHMSDERPGLFLRLRGHLSLSRVQATLGIIAALLSIGGALYGYLRPGRTAAVPQGEVVAIVQEAKTGKPVSDATVELLTPKDVLVTSVPFTGGQGRRAIKEGTYRLRVTHPRYATEVRQ